MKDLQTMVTIQEQKRRDIAREGTPGLDSAQKKVAREKREAFDFPMNAVKVDPLR